MTHPPSDRPASPVRLWAFRFLATLGLPAIVILALEAALRLAGFGHSAKFLIPDERPGYYRTNPDFTRTFLPGAFDLRPLNFRVAAHKPPGTLRVVVLGESAAQGVPMPALGFAAQLRAQLRARHPGQNIEVINAGIVAVNSHVIVPIARELAGFSPDLFVVYVGNNEVVGPYGPGSAYLAQMPPLWFIRLSIFVRSTRLGQLAEAAVAGFGRSHRPVEWGGMAMFVNSAVRGDDPRLEAVYGNFRANLEAILGATAGAGTPTVLCTVVSNLKDCAPLLSLHRAGLTAAELARWRDSFDRGRLEWLSGDLPAAQGDLSRALQIDSSYADTSFLLGRIAFQSGNPAVARDHFITAQRWDALRFRPDPRLNAIIRQVAQTGGSQVRLLDTATLLGSDPQSAASPAGREILFEHVHFNWEGNYRVARLIAESAEGRIRPSVAAAAPWLESAGCAAALAYTPQRANAVWQKVAGIVQHPPFTNQISYCEDEAALARQLARAQEDRRDPAQLRRASEAVQSALAGDPFNADLPEIAGEIAEDRGDLEGALAQVRKAEGMQPRNYWLIAKEAMLLDRLGRFAAAGERLNDAAARAPAADGGALTPAYADWFARTRRWAEGRRYLETEMRRRPEDPAVPVDLGRLEELAGNDAAAERDWRAALAAQPGNQAALEAWVELLQRTGRSASAAEESRVAAAHQPGNWANNLRAAIGADLRGDHAEVARCLLAAERSGPVSPGVESKLARELALLGRPVEAALHAAEGRRLAQAESVAPRP